MDEEYIILEDSVRNTFGGVIWSHKIQEKQADIYSSQYKYMETAKIVAASLTSVGIQTRAVWTLKPSSRSILEFPLSMKHLPNLIRDESDSFPMGIARYGS